VSDHMVVVVDPRFTALLRELRGERGLSLRQLGVLVNDSHTYLWEIETSRKQPTVPLAAAVDTALDAGGRLAELVTEQPASALSPTLDTTGTPIDRSRLERLAASTRTARPAADALAEAARWARIASWLYELFVRRRPRLMRQVPRRYSPSWRTETGLTPFRAEATAQGRAPHTECHSVTAVPAPALIAERLGLSADKHVLVCRENRYYADGDPVQLCFTYLPADLASRADLSAVTTPDDGGLYARLDRAGHRLTRAREEIGARLPTPYETTVLRVPAGIPVLEVVHTGFASDGRPIEVTRFVLRADLAGIDCEMPVNAHPSAAP
jgi:GntR family transcriptional regulator